MNSFAFRPTVFDNDVDIFIPEFWANEALLTLEQNLVFGNLVHRDFEDQLQQFGDTINIARPGKFKARRKTDDEQVVIQDATAGRAQVKLDQHWHTSFIIKDGEESKSYQSLIDTYITPAMSSIAESMDKVIAGQYHRFLHRVVGRLGGLTPSTAKDYILDARALMTRVPLSERSMILSGSSETEILKLDNFLNAAFLGDDGSALREASLGRKLGFDFLTSPNIADVNATASTATTTSASASAGSSTIAVTSATGFAVGRWITVAGDDTPLQVSNVSGTTITLYLPLRRNVASGAAVTLYTAGAVNQPNTLTSRGLTVANGYPAGWHREIAIDGFTTEPGVGHAVTFGTNNASVYTIIEHDTYAGITLDRPLEFAIADNVAVNPIPAGAYNLAMHRNALALVTRPLAVPRQGTGALSSVVESNGYAMRSTITYDGRSQGHLVTLDMLAGIALLDAELGVIMLG